MLSPIFSLSPSFSWVSPPIWEDHCYWPFGLLRTWWQSHFVRLQNLSQNSCLSQRPEHMILGHWWTDFPVFEADLECAFFAFTTLSFDRPMFRHFCLIVLATENASFISATWAFGPECKHQLTLSLELECHKATNESSSHADIQPSMKVRLAW